MSFDLKLPAFILGTASVCGSAIVSMRKLASPRAAEQLAPRVTLIIRVLEWELGKIIAEAPHQGGYILDPRRSSVLASAREFRH